MSQTKAQLLDPQGDFTLTGQLIGVGATFSGNVSIAGTLTKQDVTNVDSVGVITARTGIDCDGTATFGANGSITSGGNFTLSGNGLTVTGSTTTVGEFKGATLPTVQITQTTNNTDLQLRANADGGLVRTAANKPLILGTSQEERLRINEANAFVTVNHGNAENNAALILSKHADGYAKLEFDVGTSQKAYVELDGSEDLVHYGAAGVAQLFYAGANERLRITSAGRIGINTNSPDHLFECQDNNSSIAISRTAANAQLLFKSNSVGQAGQIQVSESSGGGVMIFSTKTTGGTVTERLRLSTDGAATFAGTVSDSKGNLRSIPRLDKTSAYTITAADAGKAITADADITIPNSVMSEGDAVTIFADGSADITITQGSGLTMYNSADGSTGNRTLALRGVATIWFKHTSYCYISGSGLS